MLQVSYLKHRWGFLTQLKLTRWAASFLHHHLRAILSSVSMRTDGVRVMCGDGSPYSTVHQVIPGGHVEETVQGEPVREQLENRITQVWISG